MKTTSIYLISDEIGNIRYIGKSNNPRRRLNQHINDSFNLHKYNWLQSIIKRGYFPKIEVIDEVPIDEWEFWEVYWISQFKTWGFNLLNVSKGGSDMSYVITEKSKVKMRKSKLGIKLSEEHKAKIAKGVEEKAKSTPNYNKCYDKSIFLNKEELHQKYIIENLSMPETALYFNVSETTLFRNLKEFDIVKDDKLWRHQCAKNKRKTVLQYTKSNEFIREWESVDEAVRQLNLNRGNVAAAARGVAKSAGGFIWKYK